MKRHRDGLYFENRSDPDNTLVIAITQSGELSVVVSEEHAVDSYNATFSCSFYMSRKDAAALRDYMNKWFGPIEPPEGQ